MKTALRAQIQAQLEEMLNNAREAADQAHHAATHEESVAETQYDTLGLEASYLAHGQSERVAQLEEELILLRQLPLKEFDEDTAISIDAVVSLTQLKQTRCYYLLPVAGGTKLQFQRQDITIVSPEAPLAQALIGRFSGDEVDLPDGKTWLIDAVS